MFLEIILLSLVFLENNLATKVPTQTQRKWVCNERNRCVPLKNETSNQLLYDTQSICRLSCGRFGSLWPRPTGETLISHDRVQFDIENIGFNLTNVPDSTRFFVDEITHIFRDNLEKDCREFCTQSIKRRFAINILVKTDTVKLSWETDESYSLTIITTDNIINVDIQSETVFGARHALESLGHLITPNETGFGLVTVSCARIKDKPVYKHRGLLLDTARNFIPLPSIEKTLDAMAASKLNVFHWHATDTQSFPLEIIRIPEFQRYGAYSPSNIYSRADIKNIIQYAKYRGIRVIIEIDAPSHSGNGWNWGPEAGLGDLAVCVNQQPWRKFCIQPPCGQLNPVNENLYPLLRELFLDIVELNPEEEIFHMGGDEVFLGCWNSTQEIITYLDSIGRDRSVLSFLRLWSDYQTKSLKMWDDASSNRVSSNRYMARTRPVILWSSHLTEPEVIERFLSKDRYIIQTWVPSSNPLLSQLLSKGYRLIVSTKDAWYLDHGFWGITQYYDWKRVYNNRLIRHTGVLGGEACMWSEYVDENSLDERVWPRAGAVAERLWSDPETDAINAESRFFAYREKLISRGIKPGAVSPQWCTINDGECQ